MKFVINADDFAFSPAVTDGIIVAHQKGVVTSTTVLCNSPFLDHAVRRAEEVPDLGLGCHLNLTSGRPLTGNRALTKEDGAFMRVPAFLEADVDPQIIYDECKAQIEMFLSAFGRRPTHLDGHYHITTTDKVIDITRRLAQEYDLEVRDMGPFRFEVNFFQAGATKENLLALVERAAADGVDTEIMCHPGFCDREIYETTSYAMQRVDELRILIDPTIREAVEALGAELVHY